MTHAWMPSLTGRILAMALPDPRQVDPLMDLPETLAGVLRFNATVPGGSYSVAQHCCVIADTILDDGGDADTAVVGLLHDAHEYIWGDITTPQMQGLAEIEAELFQESRVVAIIHEAKRRADKAIFKACGVPWPPSPQQLRTVKTYDLRMLATEKRQLLAPCGKRWQAVVENAEPLKMRGGLKIWSRAKAADGYRDRLVRLCPAVARKSNR